MTSFKKIFLPLVLLAMSSQAWGGQAYVYVYSSPQEGGNVYVATSQAAPDSYSKTKDNAQQGGFMSSGDKTFYLYYSAKEGYKFQNWYKTNESNYNNATTVTNTSDLKNQGQSVVQSATGIGAQNSYYAAVFAPITYTMIFHGNGNTGGSMANQTYKYNTEQALKTNAFVREYTVSFDAAGGSCETQQLTASYPFLGWASIENGKVVYTNGQKIKNLTSVDGSKFDLYAKWGTASVTLPEPVREGFLFDGWYSGDTWIGTAGTVYTPTADISLTARWAEKLTPVFVLSDTEVELEKYITLTMSNVSNPTIEVTPEGYVAYNAETSTLTALRLGTVTISVTQEETDQLSYLHDELSLTVIKKKPLLLTVLDGNEQQSITITQGSSATLSFEKESDAEVVVTNVSGGQYASYANGKITASEVGTAVFRATLPETNTYQSTYVDVTVVVAKDNSHLPISDVSYTLGSGSAVDWTHKHTTLHFIGVPDKLSFKFAYIYQVQGDLGNPTLNYDQLSDFAKTFINIGNYSDERKGVGNTHMLYVEESADGNNWSTVWTDDDATNMETRSSDDIQLKRSTRYVRFHHSCNFSNSYSNITITELKYVEKPEPATIDLGTATINSGEVSATSLVNWCNVASLSVTSSNPRFTVSPTQFGSYEQYGSQQLTISFVHNNQVGPQETDISISNGNPAYDKTIHVTANTTKRPQTITWNTELVATGYAMNVDEQFPDTDIPAVATASSGERVVFTSDNSDIIEVIADTALLAKAVGTVHITALQAGNSEYDETTDTQEFTVSELLKQSITWEQNLYTLLTTSEPLELTATATSGGEITYTSADPSVVKVESNVLTVVGEGETYITASQEGGDIAGQGYLPVSMKNYVIVRNPASQCNGIALSQNSLTLNASHKSQDYNLVGIPATLTFTAKHGTKSTSTWGDANYSSLIVEQYANIDGLWDWIQVYEQVVGTNDTPSGDITLDESATKIRIRTMETGTDHTINNIRVTRKKFMRADVAAVDEEIESHAIWQKTITVSHSNIDLMTLLSKQGLVQLSTMTLGEGCDDLTDDKFTVSFTPLQKYVDYYDTIVITDGKAQPSTIEVPMHFYSHGLNQSIVGFELPTTAMTTDEIVFSASATSGQDIIYLSSDSSIAYVENNRLIILNSGTIEITALQEGNSKYDPASISKTITISKMLSVILKLPTASALTYGQTLDESQLTDGLASIDGTFTWAEPNATPEPGINKYVIVFTPANSILYAETTAEIELTVNKAPQSILWNESLNPIATDEELELTATATSGLDVVFSVSDETVASVTGNVLRALAEGTVTITAAQPGNDYYEAAESIERQLVVRSTALIVPQIIWEPIATSVYFGQPLSASRLEEGEADVEGIFRWENDTLVLPVGTHIAQAIFVPTDTLTYTTVSLDVEVSVLVPPTTYGSYTAAFCLGDSAEFNGVWYHESVEKEILLPEKNKLGGDSIVRLAVTVHPVYAFADAQTIYQGAQQEWQSIDLSLLPVGDTTLVTAYTSVNGCDSVYTLSLTVLVPPTTYGSYATAFCSGDSVQFDGVWYNAPIETEVVLTQKNHLGGDSIVHLTVGEHPTYTFEESLTTHQRMSDTWQGIALGQLPVGDTTLVVGYTATEGCDSVYTLHLSVLPQIITYGNDTIRLCAGERATYEGKTYRRPTKESVLLSQPNQYGGDSIVELVVYVFPAMRFSAEKTIREKDAETWQGYDLSMLPVGDTTLVAPYTSVNGCDSTYTLHLSVLPCITTYGNDTIRLCAGEQAEYEGKIYTQSTVDSVLLSQPNQYGCDSIVELVVEVFPVMQFTEEKTIRERHTETWQGYELGVLPAGDTTLVAAYTSAHGCDSVYTLHLTVLPWITTYGNDTIRFCEGEEMEYAGKIYTQSATDSILFSQPNQYGCDSIVVLVAEMYPVAHNTAEQTITEGENLTWEGYDLSVMPIGYTTLVAAYTSTHGCDSTYTLYLTVLPKVTTYGNDIIRLCEGEEMEYEGKIYTQSTVDSVLLSQPNQYGGDSIVELVVLVFPVTFISEEDSITEGDTVFWQGYDLSVIPAGDTTLVAAYTSVNGCDSTYTLHLIVLPKMDEAIDQTGATESYRVEKYFRDGLIYIRKGDAWYDLMGVRIQ